MLSPFFVFLTLAVIKNGDLISASMDTFRCIFRQENKHIMLDTEDIRKSGFRGCANATYITITSGDTLYSTKYDSKHIDYLLSESNAILSMCIVVANSDRRAYNVLVPFIRGNCEGAQLKFINNANMETLTIGLRLLDALNEYPDTQISVHGNRKLSKSTLETLSQFHFIDVQEYGECLLPSPLISLGQISSDNCTVYYGPLLVDPKLTRLKLPSSMEYKYKWTGCIQIENTQLEDIKFLRMFYKFNLIPGCRNEISKNKYLCPTEELDFIYSLFAGLRIYDNKKTCQHDCLGGLVTEDYLRDFGNCSYVHGDLIISDWKEKSPYVQMLRNVRKVKGRLIIRSSQNLGNFNYFSRLETVNTNTRHLNGSVHLIIVQNNPDLTRLSMPNLKGIKLRKDDPHVQLENNPMLILDEDVSTTAPGGPVPHSSLLGNEEADKREQKARFKEDNRLKYIFITLGVIAILALLFIVLIILLLLLKSTLRKQTFTLPAIPSTLSKKSKYTLTSISKNVLLKDPKSWSTSDQELLWRSERSAAGADDKEGSKGSRDLLKGLMIPLAVNARLPFQGSANHDKLLLHRIEELFMYDTVIMIGSGGDVCRIVPRLPVNIGVLSMYNDDRTGTTYSFKLIEIYHLSRRTVYYKYEVKDVNKYITKVIHVLYYNWHEERLPMDFDELLQIIQFCVDKKTVCVSDRRKEVFSILYLMFKTVLAGRQINLVELFQFHLRNCNGSPLDRDEMLFVLRTIIRWSQETSCISENDKEVNSWCQSYTQLAAFTRAHPHIRNIRPDHLLGFDIQIVKELEAAGGHGSSTSVTRLIKADQYEVGSAYEAPSDTKIQANASRKKRVKFLTKEEEKKAQSKGETIIAKEASMQTAIEDFSLVSDENETCLQTEIN